MTKKLPIHPHISHLKKQAKELLADTLSGNEDAIRRIKVFHPRGLGLNFQTLTLADAQLTLAREYGFESWPRMKKEIDTAGNKTDCEKDEDKQILNRALEDLQKGRLCILFDDEGRENEGDFVLAAEKASPEMINFMTKHGRGTLCLAMTDVQTDKLGLRLVNPDRKSLREPAFMLSIDAVEGVTTGVSAFDRSTTIRTAVAEDADSTKIRSPGHIFPLKAHPEGIRARAGHTEGSVELLRMAGMKPAAAIIEIMNEDGTMARLPDLTRIAKEYGIQLVRMSDLLSA